jgi:hypothetical protein
MVYLGQGPLQLKLGRYRHVLVADILLVVSLNIMFIQLPTKSNWIAWLHLLLRLMVINSSNEKDVIL